MANFVYTWTTGHKTEFPMPSSAGGCDSQDPNETTHNNAIINLVGGDDPTPRNMSISGVAIDYLEDKAIYLVQAISSAEGYLNVASGNTEWWKDLEQNCKDWNNWVRWCRNKGKYCNLSRSNIGSVYDDWKPIKAQWIKCVEDLRDLLVFVRQEIETLQTQSVNQATINQTIANANISISQAKGMEVDVERKERMSKFITLILPIVFVVIMIIFILRMGKRK
tara:strand:+ start:215 stop:880 length:666 start_codon:yes stop_codon:yes gene_type:complete